jgi:hypothetical protein
LGDSEENNGVTTIKMLVIKEFTGWTEENKSPFRTGNVLPSFQPGTSEIHV